MVPELGLLVEDLVVSLAENSQEVELEPGIESKG
jgi:hypothetical protein